MAKEKKDSAKAVTTKSVKETKEVDKDGLVEVELIKDHGSDKKGDKLKRHYNTAQMLIDHKIAK